MRSGICSRRSCITRRYHADDEHPAPANEIEQRAAGAFVMQFMVQGAWGIVPAHLNELSPAEVRGTFPGFAYQLGNLIASVNATLQAQIAATHGGDYGLALALVAGSIAIALAILAALGSEARGTTMHSAAASAPSA